MRLDRSRWTAWILTLLAGAMPAAAAQAQPAFPERALRVIVPFTPGSGSDISARFFGEKLAGELGQPVVIENRPGAAGNIGLQAAKAAPADGYTIVLASNSPMCVNPLVMKDLPYDPVHDFKPISGLSRGMNVVLVPPDSPYDSLQELVAAARAAKAPMNVGTYSEGYRLAAEWLASLGGFAFANVPYKGQAPIITDVIGGRLDFALVDLGGARELIQDGKVKALAVSGEQRNRSLPDIPTIRESGYADYVQYSWASFYVRSETPPEATSTLAAALQKILDTDEARAFVARRGSELMPYPPERMAAFQRSEQDRFRRIAEAAGIRPQ